MDDQTIFNIDPSIFDDSDFDFNTTQNIQPNPVNLARIASFGVPTSLREIAVTQARLQARLIQRVVELARDLDQSDSLAGRQLTVEGRLVTIQFGVETNFVDEFWVEEPFPPFVPENLDRLATSSLFVQSSTYSVFTVTGSGTTSNVFHPEGLIPRTIPPTEPGLTVQSHDSIRYRELILLAVLLVREQESFGTAPAAWPLVVNRVVAATTLTEADVVTIWNLQFGGRINLVDLLFVWRDEVYPFILSNLRYPTPNFQ